MSEHSDLDGHHKVRCIQTDDCLQMGQLEKYEIGFFQGSIIQLILYTSILFSDIRCRRLFRRCVVFTVSMSKLLMARTLVSEKDLQRRSLGRQMNKVLDGIPRGRSRDKYISGV